MAVPRELSALESASQAARRVDQLITPCKYLKHCSNLVLRVGRITCGRYEYQYCSFLLCRYRGDHTETVDIQYDPTVTSYREMLKMFWNNHDSTACHSRQYMSAIFYHDEEQKKLAEQTKEEHQKTLSKPIVTRITEAGTFYEAEK